MALFSRNKQNPESKDANVKQAAPQNATLAATNRDLESVIIKPRITEKAVGQSEKNVYVFLVRRDATKNDVKLAVKALWNVTPMKVNIVNKSPRQSHSRRLGRTVSEKGMKKAYVYLKAGETINII